MMGKVVAYSDNRQRVHCDRRSKTLVKNQNVFRAELQKGWGKK